MNNNSTHIGAPTRDVAAALVLLFPLASLVSAFGIGASTFAFLLAALLLAKPAGAALARHAIDTRAVLLAFALNLLFALLCVALREGGHVSALEKPARMLAALSAMLVVLVVRPDRRRLWWGVAGGALAGALVVAWQRWGLGIERPGALLNAITFGDLSLCLGLVALAGTVDLRGTREAIVPALGALAGLAGSIISGSRGGWVALLLAGLLFVRYSRSLRGRVVGALLALSCVVLAASYLIPQTGVRDRVAEGVNDVRVYFNGGTVKTHVGIRLELWKGALILIRQHPLAGIDVDAYKDEMRVLAQQGRLDPVVLAAPHLHNDALQALVTGGVLGFLAWAATLMAPFVFFARSLGPTGRPGNARFALALAGMLVVLSYFAFGLTEVIFWSVKACDFYALMIFLLMGFCLNAKEDDGQ
ncbi:MAG: O-antigen ligase family protein [Pseudomonadota bacterium]